MTALVLMFDSQRWVNAPRDRYEIIAFLLDFQHVVVKAASTIPVVRRIAEMCEEIGRIVEQQHGDPYR